MLVAKQLQLQDGRYEKSKAGIGNVHGFHAKVGDIKSFFAHNLAETLELLGLRSQEGSWAAALMCYLVQV